MNILGPHVIFSNARPTAWCYFKLDPSNIEKPISFYTAPYSSADGDVIWTESPLEDRSLVYLYDTKEQKPSCYVMDDKTLYDVPLQKLVGQPHVNVMRKINLKDHEITRSMANGKRASDYAVMTEEYPEGNLSKIAHHLPELPITNTPLTTPTPIAYFISADDAKKFLEVTQCIKVENEADCPVEINKGCMYVWKTDETWSFKVKFLGALKTGEFDKNLDHEIIEILNTQALGDITPEINSIRLHLNRPYLNLTPHQQAIIVATMTSDWPLTAEISPDTQAEVCRAIVGASLLSEDMPQSEKINSDINAFRPYLFPSTINRLYGHQPLFTTTPAPTIADIILFTDYLLMGAAQALGDEAPFTIPSPPKSSDVICGQLEGIDSQSRLIYQGLSEGQSELFQLIMRAEMQGMNDMPIEDLMQMGPIIHAVMEPSERGQEFIELSNNLIAAMAAQQGITQEEAKNSLKDICDRMIAQAHGTALIRLISMPQEEALEALQRSENEPFNSLIQWFANSTESAQANRDAVVQHQTPIHVAVALATLHNADLLTGEAAQANFNAVIQHQDSEPVASALAKLHNAGLLTGEAAQANFNAVAHHKYPIHVADALAKLHQAGLLTGESAQANRDAVIQHQSPGVVADALTRLHRASMLTGESAQANRNAVAQHKFPIHVAGALATLHNAGLLTGEAAQANRDAVVQHPEPGVVVDALTRLHRASMLTGESAQANRNAVAKHRNPREVASALSTLHAAGLLTGDSTQANRDAVAKHRNPRDVASALSTLHAAGLLTGKAAQANFKTMIQHQSPFDVASALTMLHRYSLLTGEAAQANIKTMIQHRHPGTVAYALTTLHAAGLLTGKAAQANFKTMIQHQNPRGVASALARLHNAALLTGEAAQDNFNAVIQHQDPAVVEDALTRLHHASILTGESAQANRDAVIQHQSPCDVADALAKLHKAGLLTGEAAQANRDVVAQSEDPITTTNNLIHSNMKEKIASLKSSIDDKEPGPTP